MHRYCFMQCVFYMVSSTIYLHFSRLKLRSIMNSKLAIHESESPRPAASSIMISQMTSSSVIIPYVMEREGKLERRMMNFIRYLQHSCFSCIDFYITLNYIYFV